MTTWQARIAAKAAPYQRELDLLKSVDGFGDTVAQAWLAEIGPAPHEYFDSHEKLASWVTLCPGTGMSAGKRKHGRTGQGRDYIKPMLVQAAWSAIRTAGPLQARYHRLVRRFGGPKNPAAVKKAILGMAHTLLKIAYEVLRSGKPYEDLGPDFYTRRKLPSSAGPTCCGSWKSSARAAPSPSPPRRLPDDPRHSLHGRSLTPSGVTRPARTKRSQRRTHNASPDPSPRSQARVRCRAPVRAQVSCQPSANMPQPGPRRTRSRPTGVADQSSDYTAGARATLRAMTGGLCHRRAYRFSQVTGPGSQGHRRRAGPRPRASGQRSLR